jgi:uncharacterized surface protein with fasciclin (FAS1) repeats
VITIKTYIKLTVLNKNMTESEPEESSESKLRRYREMGLEQLLEQEKEDKPETPKEEPQKPAKDTTGQIFVYEIDTAQAPKPVEKPKTHTEAEKKYLLNKLEDGLEAYRKKEKEIIAESDDKTKEYSTLVKALKEFFASVNFENDLSSRIIDFYSEYMNIYVEFNKAHDKLNTLKNYHTELGEALELSKDEKDLFNKITAENWQKKEEHMRYAAECLAEKGLPILKEMTENDFLRKLYEAIDKKEINREEAQSKKQKWNGRLWKYFEDSYKKLNEMLDSTETKTQLGEYKKGIDEYFSRYEKELLMQKLDGITPAAAAAPKLPEQTPSMFDNNYIG